jgi:succinate-semialdehyde dehydrogenase / glutarate-semialdehyde dehydrogenase
MERLAQATVNTPLCIDRDLFIGGDWRDGHGDTRIEVMDPSTAEVLATVADADIADAGSAVDAATAAMDEWQTVSPRGRADVLQRSYEAITNASDQLARLISLENGKTLSDAYGEVAYAAEFFRWYAEEAVRNHGSLSTAPSGRNRIMVQHQPIGVALLVTPWNFPAAMATRKIAPALAAGCTTILKPASQTPLTAYAIASLLADAGVPSGAVNVITTSRSGAIVGALLRDPRVRMLSFTGSTEVGRVLLREAADQVIKCAMELGGNAPLIVFDDADLDVALRETLVAKMRNTGQACTAANRIYVHARVYDEFVARLAAELGGLAVGPATDAATECGPLIDEAAVSKVQELVQDACTGGAQVVVGGAAPSRPGYYYLPTVVRDVAYDAAITRTEIFGPVAAVMRFEREDEVLAAANATEYGLSAYVFTRDLSRALRVAERLESGMVAINRGLLSDPAAPFGGVKQSGLGREGSTEGLREFTETKYIAVDW